MSRLVFPGLFRAASAPVVADGETRVALRWILHTSVGMPRALFKVWHFAGPRVPVQEVPVQSEPVGSGARLLSWNAGPAAVVQLIVNVPAGGLLLLRALTGASGAGDTADEESVAGPVTNHSVVLFGSPVSSVQLAGTGTVTSTRIVPIYPFVDDPGWKLVETVGLPADDAFAATGYPLDPQGPVGQELPPVDAAIRRIKRGTPDAGWSAVTDRGTGVPIFVAPDPSQLVTKELRPLLETVARLLADVSDPAKHAEVSYPIVVRAPRSVHGVAASAHWESKAHDSRLFPLGNMLVSAGTDPFSALALGFGTTLGPPAVTPGPPGTSTQPPKFDFYMITVEHKVTVMVSLPTGETIELPLVGELATLCMELQPAIPPPPASLVAEPSPLDPPRHLDPPAALDGRWLEAPNVSWAVPVITADSNPRPTAYAVARGFGAAAMEMRLEPRTSGGWAPFVAAEDPDSEPPALVRFTDDEVLERFPGDTSTVVFSVAATDWFGRWTGWVSADHSRIVLAPQIPTVKRVLLDVLESPTPLFPAAAAIEFSWDWSHRSPNLVTLRTLVHAEGTAAPTVNGSVLEVGGALVPDTVLDFSLATVDAPPAGVTLVPDESTGNLRTYRVVIPGLAFDYADHPRIRVTVMARATERVGFGAPSAFSPPVSAQAASPIPPPPPFVPAAMTWASLPDPKGIARITIGWAPSAPKYAVYEADETALCRELSLASPDLEVPAADRLVALRPQAFAAARRAFTRVGDNITANSLAVELPRGSRMIHFYGVTPVSATGVEGQLPAGGNDYIAVATPAVAMPELPELIARDRSGTVQIRVDVSELRVRVGRVEIFRALDSQLAVMAEHAGPPIAVLDAAGSGVRDSRGVHFEFVDTSPGKAWQSTFYRAVAWGEAHPARGTYSGRSPSSRAVEVVVTSTVPPALTALALDEDAAFPNHRLFSFATDVSLQQTPRGVHVFTARIVTPDGAVATRRVRADALPLLSGTLPGPDAQPDSIFRYDVTNPATGRTYAWVPHDVVAVVAEITDPSGRATRAEILPS